MAAHSTTAVIAGRETTKQAGSHVALRWTGNARGDLATTPIGEPLPLQRPSVVVGFVHGNGALLPIGGRLDPILAQSALVNEMPAQGLRGGSLCGDPGVTIA